MDQPIISDVNLGISDATAAQDSIPVHQMNVAATGMNNGILDQGHDPNKNEEGQGDKDYIQAVDENADSAEEEEQNTDTFPSHSSTSVTQPSSFAPAHEPPPSLPPNEPLSSTLISQPQEPYSQSLQDESNLPQPSQDAFVTQNQITQPTSDSSENSDDQTQDGGSGGGGVNYQALLDNLSPSTAAAPSAENVTAITTAAPSTASNVPRPDSTESSPLSTLPLPPGLPPRPPPQEKPVIHPNYQTQEDIRSYHFPHAPHPATPASNAPQANVASSSAQGLNHSFPPNPAIGSNGLPPPPLATFQQPPAPIGQVSTLESSTIHSQLPTKLPQVGDASSVAVESDQDEAPWPPELEKRYADFLNEEAVYVAEGVWDKFPSGSRLFVGNLFSEKVTKRDLFFVFHRYGSLAQISIKNAYGFIQFYDAAHSNRALQGEQGSTIRGRKIRGFPRFRLTYQANRPTDLEISKPQKNSRNAAATTAGNDLRAGHARRSRSPDYDRGGRGAVGRTGIDRGVPYNNFSSDVRRRDDYRPLRSPSPRGFRGRDEYRGRLRSPDRYYGGRRSRSRSPYRRHDRYRSRSPRARDMDDEANLPMPPRHPSQVPEVQLILVDEVDRTFVAYIEKTFRDRGLTCNYFQLPRVSLIAMIKRQIVEGVQAVVKIFRESQVTGKIPLQVFDHGMGVNNVRYEEYNELDAHIAAELVVRAKAARIAPPPVQQPVPPSYGFPQYGRPPQPMPQPSIPPQQPQQPPAAPNIANLITSLDGPALQKLLGAMAQNPQSPQKPQHGQHANLQQPPHLSELSSILGSHAQQPQAQQGYPQYPQSGPPPPSQNQQQQGLYGAPQANGQAYANNPALASLLANVGANRTPTQQQQGMNQPGQQQNVQNIMEQLARWKQ
ncbi:MAG: hypothetical protein Q9222_000535 [Ikaeria aurantiellina]